jgi:hypothetical protein
VNSKFYSLQSALVGLGQCRGNELTTDSLASEVRGYGHPENSRVGAHLSNEWQYIAPANQPLFRYGDKVDASSCEDVAVVRERLLRRPRLGEREKAPLAANGVEQNVKPLEVALVQRLKVHRHVFRDA